MNNIEISNLSKTYKGGVVALENITFTIGSGVFGLLGHNGAGKTTLMKAITTILQPTVGTISVCGFDVRKQGDEVRKRIGYLPQELTMYPSLSVFEFVGYMAEIKGVYNKQKVLSVLEQVGMSEFAKRKISQLSGGMKRRVGIAQALIGDPQILVVDEPTAGLDPEERVRFRGVLSRYAKGGKTVVLSTHIVEDVYQLCEKLAVLRKGRLFFCGTPRDLMKRVDGKVKIVHLDTEEQLIELQEKATVIGTTYENGHLSARIMDEKSFFTGYEPVTATLEDAYVYCMGGKVNA
jgi:ABC-2 type transport system ATP-binding protein